MVANASTKFIFTPISVPSRYTVTVMAGVPTKSPTMANPRSGLVFILYALLRRKFRLGIRILQYPRGRKRINYAVGAVPDDWPGYTTLDLMRTMRAKLL